MSRRIVVGLVGIRQRPGTEIHPTIGKGQDFEALLVGGLPRSCGCCAQSEIGDNDRCG